MRLRGSFGFACALLVVVTGAKDDVVDYAAYDAPVEEVQRPASRIRPAARGTKLVDEVEEDARAASKADKNGEDDYSEFANKQPANGGANHELKQVTLSPEKTTYRLPPVPEEAQKKRPDPAVDRVPRPTIPAIVQPRKGYFYQHYPWDRLPRAFNLNPGLQYTYPTQFQNAAWSYPTHTLDYKGYGWYGNVNQHLQRQQQDSVPSPIRH
ncbi:hypothetical protein L596_024380 [Steinernema carpocapsae]|uniref:Secreted protein n=1 Tax=Steinernema carpocapsae TaxID=34508 RepID=A0A4U5MGJ3_STECR|nr:hypothetical protein L596_024380 [Steinernema carpocapsae]